MIKVLNPKSEFTRNVLTLMTGTTIAQAIPIAITPILTRLYTPEEFGVLALFVAITVILGTIANARYELAITLPENDEDAIEVAALGIVIASLFSVMLFIPFVLFNEGLSKFIDNSDISLWLYFVPLVVWVIGIFNVLSYLNIRYKKFQDIAKSHVYKSVSMIGVQLLLGVLKVGSTGLILGQITSSVGSVYRLSKNIDMRSLYCKIKDTKNLGLKALRYKNFLIYMLPASLMNALSSNIISLAIPTLFSIKTLGFYTLAQRSLGAPVSLIGSSIAQVYMQEASIEKNITGKVVNTFNKTLKKLVFLSCIIFIPTYFVIEDLFSIFFGESWRIAGSYAQILLPYFALNFVVSSLSVTDSIMEKQYIYAVFNCVNLLLAILIMVYFSSEFEVFVNVFVYAFSLNYGIYLLIASLVARGWF